MAGIEVIATGTQNNGLYYLSYQLPSPGTTLLGKKKHCNCELHPQHCKSFLIWHLWAGHISSIKWTVELQVGCNLPQVLHNDKTDCVLGCVFGKLSHSPHIKTEPQCDFNYREFIHIDILYLNVVGIGGFKYWLTIIEHKSHHPLCSSLKLKNDAANDIIVAVAKLEQQCDTHVKIIQCDGAGEFIGKHGKLSKFCKEKGIHLQWFAHF